MLRTRTLFPIFACAIVTAACAAGDNDDTSASTSTASTSTGATGGMGGSSSASGMGGSSSASGMGGSSSATGGAAPVIDCTAGDKHLLVSEVGIASGAHEFVEIHNPGSTAVSLDGYYISDNSTYFGIAKGSPWQPTESVKGSDFLAAFPVGTEIAAGAYITIAAGTDFEGSYGSCPDFILGGSSIMCQNQAVPAMVAPTNGSVGSQLGGMFSNSGEMVVMFCWDGKAKTVKDVDYVHWNDPDKAQVIVDKTSDEDYENDTPKASQKHLDGIKFTSDQAGGIERCSLDETGEITSNGNGISGHDETSEDTSQTFKAITTATPGAANDCK
jgi:hypothetical protein